MDEKIKRDRFSIDMFPGRHAQLSAMAKEFKVTQGEVLEAMMAICVGSIMSTTLKTMLTQTRKSKVEKRGKNKELYKKFKAEQLSKGE